MAGWGIDVSRLRSLGSDISIVFNAAEGAIPFIKVLNDIALAVNQNGKRAGAFAIYMETWHGDFLDFLDMCKKHGDERRRGQDLFYAASISDLFIQRIKESGMWTLFDPKDVPELTETYGADFEQAYIKAEHEFTNGLRKFNRNTRQLPAKEIFAKMIANWSTEGKLFWFFKDTVNKAHAYPELGIIRSSNLCVTGDTKIMTKHFGNIPIRDLLDKNDGMPFHTDVWNGEEWSHTLVRQTSNSSLVTDVYLDVDGVDTKVSATYYHKWWILRDGVPTKVDTTDLEEGDILEPWINPETGKEVHATVRVIDYGASRKEATYCGYEPKRNRIMFNNVVTGNCTEITQPTDENTTAVCNLGSLNLGQLKTVEDMKNTAKVLTRFLDNVIQVSSYSSPQVERTQIARRSMGIGVIGEAEYIATRHIEYGSEEHKLLADEIYSNISKTIEMTSRELAEEKGGCEVDPSIRNAYRMAVAPNTSSGLLAGSTCSCEPVFAREWAENSKLGTYKMVAPHISLDNINYYKNAYEVDQVKLLELTAIRQKYVDMAISHSMYIDPNDYQGTGKQVTAKDIARLILKAHELGIKTLYYFRAKAKKNKDLDAVDKPKISCVGCEN